MVSQKIVLPGNFDAAVEHFNFAGGSLGNSAVSAKICDNGTGTGYWLIGVARQVASRS